MKTKSHLHVALTIFALTVKATVVTAVEFAGHGAGGGPPVAPQMNDVTPAEQAQVKAALVTQPQFGGTPQSGTGGGPGGGGGGPGPAPYPFVPIAGTLWQDRWVNNFVDLNSGSPGILDWDCTDFTYDGHNGHDIDLRSFGEQDVGVPVFAALDGIVSASHDGELDRNTVQANQPANYVIVSHGGTHYSWYWHLRKNSVAVTNGQVVYAGTQLGLAASSGNSTGPHLHFESQYAGAVYEPSAGGCNPVMSGWVNQIPIRRDMYLEDFAVHNTNNFPATGFFPYNPYRNGTIVRTGTFQAIGCWYLLHNQPAFSNWRARYLRPNATVFFDSGAQNYGNSVPYRYATWWLWYNLNPDTAGNWTFELSVNGQVMVSAPFTVLNIGGVPVNRPPAAVTASFDPPAPATNTAVFCRLTAPLLADPDYDLVSCIYQWQLNGQNLRRVTNAAYSDAIPRNAIHPGDVLTCAVTPYDGKTFGPTNTVQALVTGGAPVTLRAFVPAAGQVALRWPTSQVNYAVEYVTNLPAAAWNTLSNAPSIVGAENSVTVTNTGPRQFFRLRFP
jgi:murein DD-endopeptidase MepM/ murein hydrolase activator NlpD